MVNFTGGIGCRELVWQRLHVNELRKYDGKKNDNRHTMVAQVHRQMCFHPNTCGRAPLTPGNKLHVVPKNLSASMRVRKGPAWCICRSLSVAVRGAGASRACESTAPAATAGENGW